MNVQKPIFYFSIIALFVLSFALPMLFAIKVGGLMYATQPGSGEDPAESLFPNAPRVSGPDNFISVPDSKLLEPQQGKDFLLVLWVKIRKLPADGERMLLLAKFDPESRSRKGYAIALTREGEIIRPEIYWRDEHENGTWFKFAEVSIATRAWLMLAVSYRQEKLLGLHSATAIGHVKPSVSVLGGYELEKPINPDSSSPLTAGSFSRGKFRGHIGAVGVLHDKDLSQDLKHVLENIVAVPGTVPPQIDEEDVGLWTLDGAKDLSLHHQVEFIRQGKEDSEEESSEASAASAR